MRIYRRLRSVGPYVGALLGYIVLTGVALIAIVLARGSCGR